MKQKGETGAKLKKHDSMWNYNLAKGKNRIEAQKKRMKIQLPTERKGPFIQVLEMRSTPYK